MTVARRLGNPACLALVLAGAWFALWQPGNLPERLEIAAELSALADRFANPVLEVHAGLALYFSAAAQGQLERARTALARAARSAEALGQPALRLRVAYAEGGCAILDGRFDDAERFAAEGLRIAQRLGMPDGLGAYHAQLSAVRVTRGCRDDALDHARVCAQQLPFGPIKAGLAWALAGAGKTAEAKAVIASLGGSSLSGIMPDYGQMAALMMLGAASVELGDLELARRIHHELLPYRAEIGVSQGMAFGPVAHWLGGLAAFLGRLDEADEFFAFAAELQEATGAHGWLVHTRVAWARLLLQRDQHGDRERARRLAVAAVELADELGAPLLAEQARELLATNAAPG